MSIETTSDAQREQAHQDELRRVLEKKRGIYQEQIQQSVDPKNAAQLIYELELLSLQLLQPVIDIGHNDPRQILEALDTTEKWYTTRGYKYPYPERLQEQREYWSAKLSEAK